MAVDVGFRLAARQTASRDARRVAMGRGGRVARGSRRWFGGAVGLREQARREREFTHTLARRDPACTLAWTADALIARASAVHMHARESRRVGRGAGTREERSQDL